MASIRQPYFLKRFKFAQVNSGGSLTCLLFVSRGTSLSFLLELFPLVLPALCSSLKTIKR